MMQHITLLLQIYNTLRSTANSTTGTQAGAVATASYPAYWYAPYLFLIATVAVAVAYVLYRKYRSLILSLNSACLKGLAQSATARAKLRIKKEVVFGCVGQLDGGTQELTDKYNVCICARTRVLYIACLETVTTYSHQGDSSHVEITLYSTRGLIDTFVGTRNAIDTDSNAAHEIDAKEGAAEGDGRPERAVEKGTWYEHWADSPFQLHQEKKRSRVPKDLFPGQTKLLNSLAATVAARPAGHVTTVFVHGEPGAGKTTLAEIIAARLPRAPDSTGEKKGLVVKFDPMNPKQIVDLLITSDVYNVYDVLVLEVQEADLIMLPENKNKWNGFFDDLNRNIEELTLIVLLTSNHSLTDILKNNKLCFSCVRRGRIDIVCRLAKDDDGTLVHAAPAQESDLCDAVDAASEASKPRNCKRA